MESTPLQVTGDRYGRPAAAGRVPITVLAGFLGSGKTTLLNRILDGGHGLRVAVFVNDFGSIDIDSRLVTRRGADVMTLDNGCICCTIGADLVSQLIVLVEGESCPEHVLIECSGVSDPGRLLVALHDPHLRSLARVDGMVTLIDAAAVDEIPPPMLELARRQLAAADVIVFNKADLVTRDELDDVRRRFTYPAARVLEAAFADVPLEVVLGVEGLYDDVTDVDHSGHGHTAAFETWSWTASQPLAYETVRATLGSLPVGVFRAKGFLYLAEAPDKRVVAHVVGRRVDIRPLGTWNGARPRTELVFISLDPNVDRALVHERLDETVAREVARSTI